MHTYLGYIGIHLFAKITIHVDVDGSNVWGRGMVTILHSCVPTANIHNNCDNLHNQVILIIILEALQFNFQ